MTATFLAWVLFILFILAMLAIDLGIVRRKSHTVSMREGTIWTIVWMSIAGLFAAGMWHFMGHQQALEFITSYIVEYSLSVDNLFVFVLIFSTFRVPSSAQHRVLFWGIIGAMIMRGSIIGVGAA